MLSHDLPLAGIHASSSGPSRAETLGEAFFRLAPFVCNLLRFHNPPEAIFLTLR